MNETSVYIDLDNIENNAKQIVSKYSDYSYHIAVIKSSAYGHGEYIVNSLVKGGINYVATSYVDEALNVRKYNKDIPILLLEPISFSDIDKVIDNGLTITIHSLEYLREFIRLDFNNKIKIHIKIDSGMNRLGVKNKEEVKEIYKIISTHDNLELEGIYTHFATLGMFDKHYDDQVEKFIEITSLIDLKNIPIVHLGSSVIMLGHPKLSFATGIRTGIAIYGYNVSPQYSNEGLKNKLRNMRNHHYQKKYNISKLIYNTKIYLKPAISMTTTILDIKKVKKGEFIGYGAKYRAKKNMLIAILPVGYDGGIGKDSLNRFVIINGKKYFVIGEISMNMMIIKIDEEVKMTDKVHILGNGITLGMLSRMDDVSLSRVLLNIGKNNKRIYLKNGKEVFTDDKR